MFNLLTYTLAHVLLSLVGLVAGLIVIGGFMSGKRIDGWTGLFLVTTFLTNATGFGFPFTRLLPSHIVAALSLVVIPVAAAALYGKHLSGSWRGVFVVGSVVAVYFNVFVLIAQLFAKVPALIGLAPTQSAPAFIWTQLLTLAAFLVIGRTALRGFRTEPA